MGDYVYGVDMNHGALITDGASGWHLINTSSLANTNLAALTSVSLNGTATPFDVSSYSNAGVVVGFFQTTAINGTLAFVVAGSASHTASTSNLENVQAWLNSQVASPNRRALLTSDGLTLIIQLMQQTTTLYEFHRTSALTPFPGTPATITTNLPGYIESISRDGRYAWWAPNDSGGSQTWHSRLIKRTALGSNFAATAVILAIPTLVAPGNFAFMTYFADDCSYAVTVGSTGGGINQDIYRLNRP